jgi:hypothetical protein
MLAIENLSIPFAVVATPMHYDLVPSSLLRLIITALGRPMLNFNR